MICEKHKKFAAYWEELGKPELEHKRGTSTGWLYTGSIPFFFDHLDYRIKGDKHHMLRRRWIDSDKTLPIEYDVSHGDWIMVNNPSWFENVEYREAQQAEPVWPQSPSEEIDPGQHYRHEYTVKLTQDDIERGSVTIKLDPFRIASIYNLTDSALFTTLKKTLKAGERGHKDFRQDLNDIINAAQRRLEMLDEDERNS